MVDAYRTEIIDDPAELGAGAATYITGYRVATLVSGGVAMIMSDHMSWMWVYTIMAGVNLVGLVTIFFAPEPTATKLKAITSIRDSAIKPFVEFFQRTGALEILIFIMVYKLSTLMATALTTAFLKSLGYSNTMIGSTSKGFGLIATIFGTLTGGSLMVRFGLKRSLWIFGVIQAMVGLTFCALARLTTGEVAHLKDLWLVIVVCMDNYMMGLGTAALTGFMMNFCNRQFTATHYALLTSVLAVSRVILVAHAGTLVEVMGYDWFFLATVPLAIPGLLLLNRYSHWETTSNMPVGSRVPKLDLGLALMLVVSLICLSTDPIWKFFKMPNVAGVVALTGAIGVIMVVCAGLVRPYFQSANSTKPTA